MTWFGCMRRRRGASPLCRHGHDRPESPFGSAHVVAIRSGSSSHYRRTAWFAESPPTAPPVPRRASGRWPFICNTGFHPKYMLSICRFRSTPARSMVLFFNSLVTLHRPGRPSSHAHGRSAWGARLDRLPERPQGSQEVRRYRKEQSGPLPPAALRRSGDMRCGCLSERRRT